MEDTNLIVIYLKNNEYAIEVFSDREMYKSFADTVKNETKLKNIKMSFNVKIASFARVDKTLIIKIMKPKKMYRFQRRTAYRVDVPLSYKLKITLDPTLEYLRNLSVVNLSEKSALINIKCKHDHILKNDLIFGKAVFKIEDVGLKTFECRVKVKYLLEDFSQEVRKRLELDNEKFFKVGLVFEKLASGMSKEINTIINDLIDKKKIKFLLQM